MVKASSSCEDSTHQITRREAMSTTLANGVTREEISELFPHLAFDAGWPSAMSAARRATPGLDGRAA
jgi:alkylhydroperoxidase/carboxymuconolactone decarboxylase family protein YurZ